MNPRVTSIPTHCDVCNKNTLRRWSEDDDKNLTIECLGCGYKRVVDAVRLWNAIKNITD